MTFNSSVLFGSLTLDGADGANWIDSLIPVKVPGSIKSRFNEALTIKEIPGRSKEWQITISGNLAGTNKDADEATLQSYDTGVVRGYSDGDHDGNYVITNLQIDKTNKTKTYTSYSLTIRQYTQTV